MWVGYGMGFFAPGIADPKLGKQAMHNAMVAHGRAVRQFRASGATGEIGIVVDVWKRHPATDSEADQALALREEDDSFRFFFDELFAGGWSPRLRARLDAEGLTPAVEPDDFAVAGRTHRLLRPQRLRAGRRRRAELQPYWWETRRGEPAARRQLSSQRPGVLPASAHRRGPPAAHEYGVTLPVYITENGYSSRAETPVDGRVHDADRITYLTGFLREAVRAATDGLDVRGYYVWSLMDNYEWTAAYTERFGLIRVDTADMARVWKDSAYWFQRVCATRTLTVED